MLEFMSLLVSYALMALADSVDAMFGNQINIDSIVVAGAMTSLSMITKSLSRLGGYTFRCTRKNRSKSLQVSAIAGFTLAIIIFLVRDVIIGMYKITPSQQELFNKCLIQWSIYIPFYSVGNDLFEQIRLDNKLKLYSKSLLWFYILLIGTDALIFLTWHRLDYLYAATTFTAAVMIVIMYKWSGVKYEKLDKEFIIDVKKYAIPIAIERLFNGFSMMLSAVIISGLGEKTFAIHSVLYGAMCTGESITNSYQAALMIKLPLDKGYDESMKATKYWMKKMFFILIGIYFVYMMISVVIYKGAIPLRDCFPWYFFYMVEYLGLYWYESMKTLCINQKVVKLMALCVPIGGIARYSCIGLAYLVELPLIPLGLSVGLDFAIRGTVYYYILYFNNKKEVSKVIAKA